jgi:myosin heavy subunit
MKTTIYLLEKTRLFCHNPVEQFHVFSKTTDEIEILLQNAGFDATSQSTFVLRIYELVKSFMQTNKYDASFMPIFLSKKKTVIGDEVIERVYEPTEFIEIRNTLVMKLYETLFYWIVDTMNTLYTTTIDSAIDTNTLKRTLGILDIFGFENLEHNHLEQLMINYTNEILQQLLNTIVIADRAILYQSEGIVDDCHYVSPMFQIHLIDTIFDDINEECMLPQGNIRGCMMKLTKKNIPGLITNKISSYEKFTVQHYAGEIEYTTHEFMERNMDRSNNEIDQFINELFHKTPKRRGSIVGKVKMNSITTQYRNNVREFIAKMNMCELHFIKCIKPNTLAAKLEFDDTLVRSQLEYNGILQFIHILKQGFSHHIPHDNFKLNFGRYVLPDDVVKYLDTSSMTTSNNNLNIKYSAVYGRTCIFITDEYYEILSKRKYIAYVEAISRISGVYMLNRTRQFTTYKKAAFYLQYVWKNYMCRKDCKRVVLRYIHFRRYCKQLELIYQQDQQDQQAQQDQCVRNVNHMIDDFYDPLIHPEPNKFLEELALCRRQLAIREDEEKQYIACISQLKRERDILIQQIAYLRNECKKGWFHRFFNN